MAVRANIAESELWMAGEDKTLRIDVTQSDGSTAQNMFGWALTWELKAAIGTATAGATISKTTGASDISIGDGAGTNDRASVTIADTDTEGLNGRYNHVLRRTDAGSEGVLSFGSVIIQSVGLS